VSDVLPVLLSAVVIMTPLLLAATGGLFTELSGRLNIALEGQLLVGAFFAMLAAHLTGSFAAGLFAAVLASGALAALVDFAARRLRSNAFIAGLAANLLAGGLTVVLSQRFFGTRGVFALGDFRPLPRAFGLDAYVYAAWALLFLAWAAIFRTPFGYRLRACGRGAEALASLGARPDAYRGAAFLVSGLFCGIGGSLLSLRLGGFVPGMAAGRGWIALVVIFLGARRPLGLLAAAFAFGLAEALSNYAQGFDAPADLVLAAPYAVTLLAMALASARAKRKGGVM